MASKPASGLRSANRKTAFILATIALAFMLGLLLKKGWLG